MAKFLWIPFFGKKQAKRSQDGLTGIGLPRLDTSFSTSDESQPLFVGKQSRPTISYSSIFGRGISPRSQGKAGYSALPLGDGRQPSMFSSGVFCFSIMILLLSSALLCGAFVLYLFSKTGNLPQLNSLVSSDSPTVGEIHEPEPPGTADSGSPSKPENPVNDPHNSEAGDSSLPTEVSQTSDPSTYQPGDGENLHGMGPGPQPNGAHGEYFYPAEEDSKILVLYQFYHTQDAWKHLHNVAPFKGICDYPLMVRPNSNDVDAASLLSVLKDTKHQGLLCEYGAMFAINAYLPSIQGEIPWIGFQSWRASDRGIALPPLALHHLEEYVRANHRTGPIPDTNVFYYWVSYGPVDFYQDCDTSYSRCSHVISAVFQELMNIDAVLGTTADKSFADPAHEDAANQDYLPPMPALGKGFSCCSYWLMHVDSFKRFMSFARMFYVTMESLFHVHDNVEACPIKVNDGRESPSQCWCFVMERLVNIWVYHTGHNMQFVDGTGLLEEQFPVNNRNRWAEHFTAENLHRLEKAFPERLLAKEADLYRQLGGTLP